LLACRYPDNKGRNLAESLFFTILSKENTMTNIPVSGANPAIPAPPQQQTQANPPKPANKPSEQ